MISAIFMSPIVGVVALVVIAAVTGRKIEIGPKKIVFWPRQDSLRNGATNPGGKIVLEGNGPKADVEGEQLLRRNQVGLIL